MYFSGFKEKTNPQVSAYKGKLGGWCDDGTMRALSRSPDNSKPRSKDYSSQRRAKLLAREKANET